MALSIKKEESFSLNKCAKNDIFLRKLLGEIF